MLSQPRGVVLGNDGSNSEEVSIVEVVIVVVTVTKIDAGVGCASLVNNTTPGGFVSGESSSGRGKPVVEGRLEVVCDIGNKGGLSNSVAILGMNVSLVFWNARMKDKGPIDLTQ